MALVFEVGSFVQVLVVFYRVSIVIVTEAQIQCEVERPLLCSVEEVGVYKECFGDKLSDLSCKYAKVLDVSIPTVPASSLNFPAAANNFAVEVFYFKYMDSCYPALNISWKLAVDGSLHYLKGYQLRVVDVNGKANITRIFNLTSNAPPNRLKMLTFYYPCIIANYILGANYEVTLQSVPATLSENNNYVQKFVSVAQSTKIAESSSERTYYWTPSASVVEVVADTVTVSFQSAPVEYNFLTYRVDLIYAIAASVLNNVAATIFINCTDYKLVTVTFRHVSCGTYSIQIRPLAWNECTCRVGPGIDDCRDVCEATDLSVITVRRTAYNSTPPDETSTVDWSRPLQHSTVGIIAGAVVGVSVAFTVIGVIAYLLFCLQSRRRNKVLLLYTSDTPRRQQVVRKLICFIKRHCACEVQEVNTGELTESSFDHLTKSFKEVFKIIFVFSKDVTSNDSDCSGSIYPIDFFNQALKYVQLKEQQIENKFCHVSFHYTNPDCWRFTKFGTKYRLLADASDLIEALNAGMKTECIDCNQSGQLVQAFMEAEGTSEFIYEIGIVPPGAGDNYSVDSEEFHGVEPASDEVVVYSECCECVINKFKFKGLKCLNKPIQAMLNSHFRSVSGLQDEEE